jgi:hypothetical protein
MNKIKTAGYGALAKIRGAWLWVGLLMFTGVGALASDPLVSYNDTTGAVTFAPAALLSPIIAGIVAAIVAGTALAIIFFGTRMVLRALKMVR